MLCWNCHKDTMEAAPQFGEGWHQCSECKATTSQSDIKQSNKKSKKK